MTLKFNRRNEFNETLQNRVFQKPQYLNRIIHLKNNKMIIFELTIGVIIAMVGFYYFIKIIMQNFMVIGQIILH